jgi:hypothetical protein
MISELSGTELSNFHIDLKLEQRCPALMSITLNLVEPALGLNIPIEKKLYDFLVNS